MGGGGVGAATLDRVPVCHRACPSASFAPNNKHSVKQSTSATLGIILQVIFI